MCSAPAVIGRRDSGARDIVTVRFIDGDHVGEFDDAFLDALQFVTGAGHHQHQKEIGHVGDGGLGLADADGLHDHHVVAAASHSSMVSRVLAATPPSVPEEGEGRMKALGSMASRAMRVLSPRMDPPVRLDDGSTASTATLWPCAVK